MFGIKTASQIKKSLKEEIKSLSEWTHARFQALWDVVHTANRRLDHLEQNVFTIARIQNESLKAKKKPSRLDYNPINLRKKKGK